MLVLSVPQRRPRRDTRTRTRGGQERPGLLSLVSGPSAVPVTRIRLYRMFSGKMGRTGSGKERGREDCVKAGGREVLGPRGL